MILAKNCNFRPSIPLRFASQKNHKKASFETNKHNFLCFSPPKVLYYYGCSWVGRWGKYTFKNMEKISFFVFPQNPHFWGSNFEFGVRGVKFENFETGKGSYAKKHSKLLISNKK